MSSSIRVKCSCGKTLLVPLHLKDKRVKCPACGASNVVSAVQTEEAVVEGPSLWNELPAQARAPRVKKPIMGRTAWMSLIGVMLLSLVGGIGWFLLKGNPQEPARVAQVSKPEPKPEKVNEAPPLPHVEPDPPENPLPPPDPKPPEKKEPPTPLPPPVPVDPKPPVEEKIELVFEPDRTMGVSSVAITRDGKYVATGHIDNKTVLWNPVTGKKLQTFVGPVPAHMVTSLALSGDGKLLVSSYYQNKEAVLWDTASGKKLHTLQGHTGVVSSVGITEDGSRVLTGSLDKTAILWDTASGMKVRTLEGQRGQIASVFLSENGKWAVTASGNLVDQTAILWDTSTGRQLQSFKEIPTYIRPGGLSLSPDGTRLLTTNAGQSILWDATSAKKIFAFLGGGAGVAMIDNGKYVIFVNNPLVRHPDQIDVNAAVLWQTGTYKKTRSFYGHVYAISDVALSGRGPFGSDIMSSSSSPGDIPQSGKGNGYGLLTGSEDGSAILWDVATGKKLQTFLGVTNTVTSVAISQDGKDILVGARDKTATLWDTATGKPPRFYQGHIGYITSAIFSADSKTIASGSNDGFAILWDKESGNPIQTIGKKHSHIDSLALSQDGKTLAACQDRVPILWDVPGNQLIRAFPDYDVTCLALSNDGKFLVTGSKGKKTTLWDATGKELKSFFDHTDEITCVALSADGKQLVTGSMDQSAILWDIATGNKLQTFKTFFYPVTCLALSSDGKFLVTGSLDKAVVLWETASGKMVRTFKGHAERVTCVALSSDGKFLITGSEDDSTRIWELGTGKELCRIYTLSGGKDWLVFTPEGTFDCSPGMRDKLVFRDPTSMKVLDDKSTRDSLHRPGLLAKVWKGEK